MQVTTINNITFELVNAVPGEKATLRYENSSFSRGMLQAGAPYSLEQVATGIWAVSLLLKDEEKLVSTIKTETGGSMGITKFYRRKKYYFRKSQNLKLRFSLLNKGNEELLTIIPSVNWSKQSHDFILQINDDFEKECDQLLILQALHCALCCLSMMTGGEVPALVSI